MLLELEKPQNQIAQRGHHVRAGASTDLGGVLTQADVAAVTLDGGRLPPPSSSPAHRKPPLSRGAPPNRGNSLSCECLKCQKTLLDDEDVVLAFLEEADESDLDYARKEDGHRR